MDRRTLLKAVPAAFAAGVVGAAVIAAPETASARATPKAAPSGSKVVVLGGNGFVGSKVCEMLVEAGETRRMHDVTAVGVLGWQELFFEDGKELCTRGWVDPCDMYL